MSRSPKMNFDELESQKENVTAQKRGRSMKLLMNLQRNPLQIKQTKISFQNRLSKIGEMDEPLQFFLEYIYWGEHAWIQGPTLKASGMLEVIEICLLHCQDFEKYLNNLEYVKLWLKYIQLFTTSTEEKRDLFIYMFRRRIGIKLVIFYTQFSELLIEMRNLKEAFKVITYALKSNIEDSGSLETTLEYINSILLEDTNNFNDLDQLFDDSNQPTILNRERELIRREFNERQLPTEQATDLNFQANERSKPEIRPGPSSKNKNLVYQDDSDDYIDGNLIINDTAPNNFQVKSERDKENKKEVELLISSVSLNPLKQSENSICINKLKEKMNIFNDFTNSREPVYKIIHLMNGKKPEKIDCNFKLIYDNRDEQKNSVEEILAISRGIHTKNKKSGQSEHFEKKRKV